jgi:hypothetical protein
MTKLIDFLLSLPDNYNQCLPFFHSCTAEEAIVYADSDKISAKFCDVFQEDLVYLFLGKGRYAAKYEDGRIRLTPVSFVFKPGAALNLFRIYPFDTGACALGFYEPFMLKANIEKIKKDFLLGDHVNIGYVLISYFFNSLNDYVRETPMPHSHSQIKDLAIQWGAFQLEEINALYETAFSYADGRRITVEVQSKDDINLKDNADYLLVPTKNYEANHSFAEFSTRNNVTLKIYSDYEKLAADRYTGKLLDAAEAVALEYLQNCN